MAAPRAGASIRQPRQQAVRALNATGETPDWLDDAVWLTARAVEHLDDAAAQLSRRLR